MPISKAYSGNFEPQKWGRCKVLDEIFFRQKALATALKMSLFLRGTIEGAAELRRVGVQDDVVAPHAPLREHAPDAPPWRATSALGEAKRVVYNGIDATLETAGEFEATEDATADAAFLQDVRSSAGENSQHQQGM